MPQTDRNPDATLISDCIKFIAWEQQIYALGSGPEAIEDEDTRALAVASIEAKQDILEKRICSASAKTAQGHLWRLQVMLVWRGSLDPADDAENPSYRDDRLLGAVDRDLNAYLNLKKDGGG